MKLRIPPTVPPQGSVLQGSFGLPQNPIVAGQPNVSSVLSGQLSQNPPIRSEGGGDPVGDEMKILYKRPLKYDNNRRAIDVARDAAAKTGGNPSLLFSSAYTEGMNKAIAHPDEVSEAYNNAKIPGDYPVDGFYNYGLDTFGDKYNDLKKYLPAGFDQRFKTYRALNDSKTNPQWVTTAAFKTNEDALMAKSAMLRQGQDSISDYAKQKGITLDPNAMNYFTLAAYNGGEGNARKMIDEYANAKDKNGFISQGLTSQKEIHKNIIGRLNNIPLADQLFKK